MAKRSSSDSGASGPKGASDELVGWSTLAIGLTISTLLLWKNGGWAAFRAPTRFHGFEDFNLFNITTLLLPPLTWILVVLRRDLSDFGLTSGNAKAAIIFSLVVGAIFAPICFLFFSKLPEVQDYYIRYLSSSNVLYDLRWQGGHYAGGKIDYGRLVYHESVMWFYMLAWEWFFRGYLLFGLRKIMPTWAAATVQMLPFFILHVGKPAGEFWSSLAGGLILAPIAIRYRSFLPCFLGHALLSTINDIAVLYHHFN